MINRNFLLVFIIVLLLSIEERSGAPTKHPCRINPIRSGCRGQQKKRDVMDYSPEEHRASRGELYPRDLTPLVGELLKEVIESSPEYEPELNYMSD